MKLVTLPWLIDAFAAGVRPLAELEVQQLRRVAVINATALGDTILSTPLIRGLRENLPHAHITWMINSTWLPVFANHPHVDSIEIFNNRFSDLFKLWFANSDPYDLVIVSHGNDPEASMAARMLGAKFIVKTPHGEWPELHSNPAIGGPKPSDHGIHKRLWPLKLLFPGAAAVAPRMELASVPYEGACGAQVIGFQVGASTASRLWPPEHYAHLAQRLLAGDDELTILLLGGPGDQVRGLEVAKLLPGEKRVKNLVGKISLAELPSRLAGLAVLVTPDTGVMHMAVALQVPTVTLFAVAHHSGSGALVDLERHRFIQGEITCDPCIAKKCLDAECMALITPEQVFPQVVELLGQSS